MVDPRYINLAEDICDPRFRTLREMIAFLSGFDYALQLSNGKDESGRGSPKLLLDWLTSEFSKPGTAPSLTWVDGLLERYLTEDAAIAAIQEFAAGLPDDVDKAIGNGLDD